MHYKFLLFVLCLLFSLFPLPLTLYPIYAHAFGALYNLPVPFWLYLYGSGATLLVSFILISYFMNHGKFKEVPNLKLLQLTSDRSIVVTILKVFSVLLFLLTILTGLIGVNNSLLNFNMTFFWVIFLLGFYYLTAIVGNLYAIINPFKMLFSGIKSQLTSYPERLGYLPALLFFMILIWMELFLGVTPFQLSLILIVYTILNSLGITLIGQNSWFKYCEVFSVLFNLLGKMSIFEVKNGQILLRPPFAGLLQQNSNSFSLVIFILFMLSSTAFDGLHTTTPWYQFISNLGGSIALKQTLGLILSPLIFLAVYLLLIYVLKVFTKSKHTITNLSARFSFSLIPVALVYNVAHYYTLLINQGQEIFRLVSDPFGFNWNLFGTADYQSKLFLDAGFIWHSQVFLILFGHVVAVYLAHLIALEIFKNRKQATLSQIPMLILMIIYTLTGLWILSQPITTKL